MYRVYTRIGDKGTTTLYGGSRIEKDHIRAKAYDTVDELISQLGVCYTTIRDAGLRESLRHIQRTLSVLGAELASDARGLTRLNQTIGEEKVTALERFIDRSMAESGPLKQFMIPGKNFASARLHIARTQPRRLERLLTATDRMHPLRGALKRYNNRLSDALFSMTRIEETKPDACA